MSVTRILVRIALPLLPGNAVVVVMPIVTLKT